jgi:hypothetical protein
MPTPCPSCGAEMEFAERAVVLRTGTCPSCAKEFAYVEGTTLSAHLPPEEEGSGATPVGAPVVVEGEALECDDCGGPLQVRAGRSGELLVVCEDCETTTAYRAQGAETQPEDRPRRDRRPVPESREGPRSRPCRRCGAPLRFTTGDDGMLVGECDSCGNRFTLPPRGGAGRESGFRGPPRGRYGSPRGRGRPGDRPFYRDRAEGRDTRYGDARRRPPAREDRDEQVRRRRRRRDD